MNQIGRSRHAFRTAVLGATLIVLTAARVPRCEAQAQGVRTWLGERRAPVPAWQVWVDSLDPAADGLLDGVTYVFAWQDWRGLSAERCDWEPWESRLAFLPRYLWSRPGYAFRLLCEANKCDTSCGLEAVRRTVPKYFEPRSPLLADWLWNHGAPSQAVDMLLTYPFYFELGVNPREVPLPLPGAGLGRSLRLPPRLRLAAFGSSALFAESVALLRTARQIDDERTETVVKPQPEPVGFQILEAYRLYRLVYPYIWPLDEFTPWDAFDVVAACEGEEIPDDEHAPRARHIPSVEVAHALLLRKPLPVATRMVREIGQLKHRGRPYLLVLEDVGRRRLELAAASADAAARILVEIPDAFRYRALARRLFHDACPSQEDVYTWVSSEGAPVLAHFLSRSEAKRVLRWWSQEGAFWDDAADQVIPLLPELDLVSVLLHQIGPEEVDPQLAREVVQTLNMDSRVALFLLDSVALPWARRDPTLIDAMNSLVGVRVAARLARDEEWARPYLMRAMTDARAAVRVEAVLQAMLWDGDWPGWPQFLARRLVAERNERVSLVLEEALARIGSRQEATYLATVLRDSRDLPPSTICHLIQAIAGIPRGADVAVPALGELSAVEELAVAVTAARALGRCETAKGAAAAALGRAAADTRWPVRAAAAWAAGQLGTASAFEIWDRALADPAPPVRIAAAGSVRGFRDRQKLRLEAARALAESLRTAEDESYLVVAYRSLDRLRARQAAVAEAILGKAQGTKGLVANAAARALAASAPRDLVPKYVRALTAAFEAKEHTTPVEVFDVPFELAALVEFARRDRTVLRQLSTWARDGVISGELLRQFAREIPQPFMDDAYRRIVRGEHASAAVFNALSHPPTSSPEVIAALTKVATNGAVHRSGRLDAVKLLGWCGHVSSDACRSLAALLSAEDQAVAAAAARQLSDPMAKTNYSNLLAVLQRPDTAPRRRAASVFWNLARSGVRFEPAVLAALRERLNDEQDLTVRVLLAATLTLVTDDVGPCTELFALVYRTGSAHQMWCLLEAVASHGAGRVSEEMRTVLTELAHHPHPRLSRPARRLLLRSDSPKERGR